MTHSQSSYVTFWGDHYNHKYGNIQFSDMNVQLFFSLVNLHINPSPRHYYGGWGYACTDLLQESSIRCIIHC